MRDYVNKTGTLGAADETVVINVTGCGSVAFQLTGTWSGTVTWQGTLGDPTTGTYISVSAANAATGAVATTTTANGVYEIMCASFSAIRANMTAYTSGTATVIAQAILAAGTTNNVTVTTDTEFPAATAASDNYANPTTTDVKSFNMLFDGTTWDRAVSGAGTAAAAARTTLASDDPAVVALQLIDNAVSGAGFNITQFGGAAVPIGAGTEATAIRVTLPTDGTGKVNAAQSGTWTEANSAAITTAVQIMDDWDNAASDGASVSGDVAHDSPDAGEPVKVGGKGVTAVPTAVTANDRVNAQFDVYGKQVVVNSLREMKGNQITTITASTSETTCVTADATYKLDVYAVFVTNTSATATEVHFKDSTAGTTRFTLSVPANDMRGFCLPMDAGHVQAAANNNWTATAADSVSSLIITVLFVKNL